MFHVIKRLRQHPEEHRKRYAFLGAAGVTLFIFIIWAISFFSQLDEVLQPATEVETTEDPFQELRESFDSL